jgi:hypothetical protein
LQSALFSAVVTAFLVLSLPLLQPDNTQATVSALQVISAQLAGQAVASQAIVPAYTPSTAAPTAAVVSINALWIISLLISLSTSVLAMLVKQWIRVYTTNLPSAPKERALERQTRYDGLVAWKVDEISNALPVLIHIAVAVFFVGLVVYLWTISSSLWVLVLASTGPATMGYLILAGLPLIWHTCPYQSPVTRLLRQMAGVPETQHSARRGYRSLCIARPV